MKQDNSNAIIVLCSHLCVGENVKPLEPSEWSNVSQLLMSAKKQPEDIFIFDNDDFKKTLNLSSEEVARFKRLIDRSASIAFEMEKLSNIGINIITRADTDYPRLLKKKLGQISPPLFYAAGDINIQDDDFMGIVGSRTIEKKDFDFTRTIVKKIINEKFSIVSGGAKGIDSIASMNALELGSVAIEFVSDSMIKKLKDKEVIKYIRDGRLLLLSATKPDAGFNVGMAMMRNKYIYAQSLGTIIVRSDYGKGGTWAGAIENLKNKWSYEYCWNNEEYKGNLELIKKGAIPIDINFDPNLAKVEMIKTEEPEQYTLFDYID